MADDDAGQSGPSGDVAFNTKMVAYKVGVPGRKERLIISVDVKKSDTSSKKALDESFPKALADKDANVLNVLMNAKMITPDKAVYTDETYLVVGVVLPETNVEASSATPGTEAGQETGSGDEARITRSKGKATAKRQRSNKSSKPATPNAFDAEQHTMLPTTEDARVMVVNLWSDRKNLYVLLDKQADGRYLIAQLASKMEDRQFFFKEWATESQRTDAKSYKSAWSNNYKNYCKEISQKMTWLDTNRTSKGNTIKPRPKLSVKPGLAHIAHQVTQQIQLYDLTHSTVYLEIILDSLKGMKTVDKQLAPKCTEQEQLLRDLVSGNGHVDLLKAQAIWLACMQIWFKTQTNKPTYITELRLYKFWMGINSATWTPFTPLPETCNKTFVVNFCILARERGLWTEEASAKTIPGPAPSATETEALYSCLQDAYEQTVMMDDPPAKRARFDDEDSMPLLLVQSMIVDLNGIIQAIDKALSADLEEFQGEMGPGTSIEEADMKSILGQAADYESKALRQMALENVGALMLRRSQQLTREVRGLLVELKAGLEKIADGIQSGWESDAENHGEDGEDEEDEEDGEDTNHRTPITGYRRVPTRTRRGQSCDRF